MGQYYRAVLVSEKHTERVEKIVAELEALDDTDGVRDGEYRN